MTASRSQGPSLRTVPSVVWFAIMVLALLVLGLLVIWIVPAWLTRHPSNGLTAADRLKATNDVRAPLVALLVAFGAGGTLVFTARTYKLNREGQVTDRYSKAVGQLGDESPPVRIGGVYALERIGIDSSKNRKPILSVLGAFVRKRSEEMRDHPDELNEDVKAALRVAGRLIESTPDVQFDLRGVDLRNADLSVFCESRLLCDDHTATEGAVPPRSC
jgi:hypothetical protein